MSKEQDRPGIKHQTWGDTKPRGTEMKESILKDVNKQIVINTSGKSGGS